MPEHLEKCDWHPAPTTLLLDGDSVDLWRIPLRADPETVATLAGVLEETELGRSRRFIHDRHRIRFEVGHARLRLVLGRYLGIDPRDIRFAYGEHGKPRLAESLDSSIRFNFTHSGDLAICAVTLDHPIGVDVEEVRPLDDALQIADRYFTTGESAALHSLSGNRRLEAFYNGWTRKEAYLKACGKGLAKALNRVEVTLTPDEPARFIDMAGDDRELIRWSLRAFAPESGFIGAVVTEGDMGRVRFLEAPSSTDGSLIR